MYLEKSFQRRDYSPNPNAANTDETLQKKINEIITGKQKKKGK